MHLCNPTVFVIEDDPVACNSIDALVSSMNLDCRTFSTAEQFLDHYDSSRPGCAVVDLRLDGMDGMQLLENLTNQNCDLPVVIVSANLDVSLAVQAMEKGAVTVLEKPYQSNQLAAAIHKAINISRNSQIPPRKLADLHARFIRLEPREREVMKLIVNGMPNKTIARELGISMRTTARIRAKVYKKMGTEFAVELAQMAVELRKFGKG